MLETRPACCACVTDGDDADDDGGCFDDGAAVRVVRVRDRLLDRLFDHLDGCKRHDDRQDDDGQRL